LDELTPLEFFNHGGIVKITINDDLVKECNIKKKYTFFDYKSYVRFFNSLYMSYMHKHQDENTYNLYKYVNDRLEISPTMGTFEYVVDLKYDQVWSYVSGRFYYSSDRRDSKVQPKDPYGIKNVCFSSIKTNDSEWDEYEKQRLERGFDVSETWSLDGTIAKFIYPRLQEFTNECIRIQIHPDEIEFDKWINILNVMTEGFRLISQDNEKTKEEDEIIEKALDLFRKHFHDLWN